MAEVLRKGKCRWLASEESIYELVRRAGGGASIRSETGLPGVLYLTRDEVVWDLAPYVREIVVTVSRWVHAPVPEDVFESLEQIRWSVALSELREVRVEGALFRRTLVLALADREELFRTAGAAGWQRSMEVAAGMVPETGLSRARLAPRDESLSRPGRPGGRGG